MKVEIENLFSQIEKVGKTTFSKLCEENYLAVAYLLAKLEDGIADLKEELNTQPSADCECGTELKQHSKSLMEALDIDKEEEEGYSIGDEVCLNDKVYKITEEGFRQYIKDE